MKVGRVNYRVDAKIGFQVAGAIQALNVLDIGADPNLIPEDTVRGLQTRTLKSYIGVFRTK